MKIRIHTTNKEPEDIVPFAMVPAFVWKLYDDGKLNLKELGLMTILYRHVNPYEGIGRTSYQKVCIWMQTSPSELNVNGVNKLMQKLRDELQLVWFPEHKGVRDFAYVLADFQRGKKDKKEAPDWIDIKPYFQTLKKSNSESSSEIHPEPMPRRAPEIQRSENRNNGGIKSIGEIMERSEIRPPYTDTNTET